MLAHLSLIIGDKTIAQIATRSPGLTQSVQGLKLYQAGDIQGAIKSWQAALSNQQSKSDFAQQINVRT
ncbi:MAG: hypothetical protein RMY28_028430 [Nostoc sp. ChiSLP01]|nr:hypothetical protein [Nostoc sp. CmiSLP01]MDZ8283077.1 hypothetical protein [Nostoc sp. ChiSLP01]